MRQFDSVAISYLIKPTITDENCFQGVLSRNGIDFSPLLHKDVLKKDAECAKPR
jgi:hypothetical protein